MKTVNSNTKARWSEHYVAPPASADCRALDSLRKSFPIVSAYCIRYANQLEYTENVRMWQLEIKQLQTHSGSWSNSRREWSKRKITQEEGTDSLKAHLHDSDWPFDLTGRSQVGAKHAVIRHPMAIVLLWPLRFVGSIAKYYRYSSTKDQSIMMHELLLVSISKSPIQ